MMWRRQSTDGIQQLPEERKALAERYTIDAEEAQRREQLAAATAEREAEEQARRDAEAELERKAAEEEARRAAEAEERARRAAEDVNTLLGCPTCSDDGWAAAGCRCRGSAWAR